MRTESIYSGLCILLYLTCDLSIYMMVLLTMHDGVKFHNESSDFRLLLMILSMSSLLPHLVMLPLDHSRSISPF